MDAWTIKQYPAKEQAELKVKVQISGSWFGGSLTPEEKRELYSGLGRGAVGLRGPEANKQTKQGRLVHICFFCS